MILSLVACVSNRGRNNEMNARGNIRKISGFQMRSVSASITLPVILPIHICLDAF